MTKYSISRVSTYEQCPYKYKLQYIDRIKVETQNTIEAFLGCIVHNALEKLYRDLKYSKINTKEEIVEYYNLQWNDDYTDDILIVKSEYNADHYRQMGEKFISDYYDTYHPFDEMTVLGVETQDSMMLPDGNQWHVRIDKLGCVGDTYYVVDYKTNSSMIDQQDADSDKQLAMYSIWVKEKYKDAKKVVLKWNMLAFNKEVTSERTDEQLQELQQEIVNTIKEIESATEFLRCKSGLCSYCLYQEVCKDGSI